MSLIERYDGYDFPRMNRERSSASEVQQKEEATHNGFTPWESPSQFSLDAMTFSLDAMTLQGRHCIYKTMAEGIPYSVMDIRKDKIRDALSNFMNAEHRLETVAISRGVTWINDSKATNVNSAWFALESTQGPIIWIAGGVDKGNDYRMLIPLAKEKVKAIVVMGKPGLKFHAAFGRIVDMIITVGDMSEAVAYAAQLSTKGDTVLLSPACASFDQFTDYQDRGRQFKMEVRNLK